MPDHVPVEPRLVKVPLSEAKIGDAIMAVDKNGGLHCWTVSCEYRAKHCRELLDNSALRPLGLIRLTTEPTTPDPRAADAEALDRLDRWARQQTTGARGSVEFTPSFAGGEEFYEVTLSKSLIELRGRTVAGKGPTLAASINAALDAAGAAK